MDNKPEYIKINNEITMKTMKDRENPDILNSHWKRYVEEFGIFSKYVKNTDKVLDLGCKDGTWFDLLKQNNFTQMVGIDCCPEVVEIASKKGYNVYIGDVQNMPMFDDESFDSISLIHTLEHVPNPDLVVSECERLLKENGIVFVEVPTQKPEEPEKWGHYHCFTHRGEVVELFDPYFQLLEVVSMDPPSKKPWHRFIFKKRV